MSTEAEDLGERIAEMAAHLDAATHRLLTDLREYDRSNNWFKQGFPDCARWLSWRVGWAAGTARDHVRVAHRLGDLPLIDDALRTGSISYSKVRAMTRVATPANEAVLLEDARHATGQQLELICRKYATVVRAAKEVDEDYDRERRTVSRRDLDDGMVRIEATLHPEEAAVVWGALDQVARERAMRVQLADQMGIDAQDSTAAPSEAALPRWGRFSRADALIEIAHGVVRGDAPCRSPIELVVTVAADVLHRCPDGSAGFAESVGSVATDSTSGPSEPHEAPDETFADGSRVHGQLHAPIAAFADGTCVSAETARRLACDCGVVHMTEDGSGNLLSVGRKTRSIPVAIARALAKRDTCCRFPGCGNRVYVEGHHIEHWADGGETALGNLVSLCFHHRFVHEYGYSVVLDELQCPHFFDPRSREVFEAPDRPRPERLGWPAVVNLNRKLAIDAETNACLWDGDRIHYDDVIDVLVRVDGLN